MDATQGQQDPALRGGFIAAENMQNARSPVFGKKAYIGCSL
jgi:hypothetical protein